MRKSIKTIVLLLLVAVALSLTTSGCKKTVVNDYAYESPEGFTEVKNKLSWEELNKFPIKSADMTEEEMRQLVVDFYNYSKNFTWVASDDWYYLVGENYGYNILEAGKVYSGFPYVSLGSNNPYRMFDYMDPKSGVVNMAEVEKSPMLFGNQCSFSAYWAWARVINSVSSCYTADCVLKNGFIPVGPYTYDPELEGFSPEFGTAMVIMLNGNDVMYESYAQLKMGDGLVRNNPGGHVILCTGTAHVEYDENGKISPERSYILMSDQTEGWTTGLNNEQGDVFDRTGNVNRKMTFEELLEKRYLPFTFKEYSGEDPIEETEVTFSHTGETITKQQLFDSKVTTNYSLSDIYAVITDTDGNEIYRLAVRAKFSVVQELQFAEEIIIDDCNTVSVWGSWDNIYKNTEYNVQIIAQLGTGERPVLWEGKLEQ